MDGVSMIGSQGNCVSPLTFVISRILSLPFLSSTLTPQISVTHPCALLIVISCTSTGKPRPCGMLHGCSMKQTGALSHPIPKLSVL